MPGPVNFVRELLGGGERAAARRIAEIQSTRAAQPLFESVMGGGGALRGARARTERDIIQQVADRTGRSIENEADLVEEIASRPFRWKQKGAASPAADIAAELGRMGRWAEGGGFKGAMAGGVIGGGVSLLTGGGFWEGAAYGAVGGTLAGKGYGALDSNRGKIAGRLTTEAGAIGGRRGAALTRASEMVKASTIQRRHAVYAGAGLAGAIFPSSRNDHKRGFNAHRGNSF